MSYLKKSQKLFLLFSFFIFVWLFNTTILPDDLGSKILYIVLCVGPIVFGLIAIEATRKISAFILVPLIIFIVPLSYLAFPNNLFEWAAALLIPIATWILSAIVFSVIILKKALHKEADKNLSPGNDNNQTAV